MFDTLALSNMHMLSVFTYTACAQIWQDTDTEDLWIDRAAMLRLKFSSYLSITFGANYKYNACYRAH